MLNKNKQFMTWNSIYIYISQLYIYGDDEMGMVQMTGFKRCLILFDSQPLTLLFVCVHRMI